MYRRPLEKQQKKGAAAHGPGGVPNDDLNEG